MIAVANDLRRAHGPAFLVENLFKQVEGFGGNIVIESLRNIAEVHKVKELGGHVIGVDAEPHIRYERVQKRGLAKDQLSFEGWIAQEAAESHPDDPMQQDIFGALRESDVVIQNDGTVEDLHQKIDAAIATFAETPNAQP
jgi:dephospho-CoA kinase